MTSITNNQPTICSRQCRNWNFFALLATTSTSKCPRDIFPNCYGKLNRNCQNDSSCRAGKKCCKLGCYYGCVRPVKHQHKQKVNSGQQQPKATYGQQQQKATYGQQQQKATYG
ncbi:hypothetical protein AM593_00461, partial [Mytilus galloprovincialis]